MTALRRLNAFVASLLVSSTLLVQVHSAVAQTAAPTSDQLDLLRSLSSDQRDQLMEQLGIGGSGGTSSDSERSDQTQRSSRTTRSQQDRIGGGDDASQVSRIPTLKPEDSVIIEVELPGVPLPPRPVTQAAGALQLPGAQATVPGAEAAAAAAAQQQQLQQSQAPASQPAQQQRGSSPSQLSSDEQDESRALIALVQSKNPYRLSRDGVLGLPGFNGIALAGLTEDQATLRLQTEPAFHKLQIRVTRLPLEKLGSEGLKPFGYDLFQQGPSTFAPVSDVPVPSDYVLGAGDQLSVQLYGSQNRTLRLKVGADGRINFPELGPIVVSGQSFDRVRETLESRVASQIIGVRASVSMGETRSIRIFVVGDAKWPGSYTVSGLSTVTSALFASGGVKMIGSLRDIELKRGGQTVRHLDLYSLLLNGDTSGDAQLMAGDVIFIPPIGPTVSVYGEVRRPAIYEFRSGMSVSEILQLAGGMTPEADVSKASVTRIGEDHRRTVTEIDATSDAARREFVHSGDIVRITRLRPTLDAGLVLEGHLYTAGPIPFHAGMRLTQAIPSVDDLRPNADIHYLLIRRELPPDRRIVALSADLSAALRSPGSKDDIVLMPRDRVIVFDREPGRQRTVQPILDELKLQSTIDHPSEVVRIEGRAKAPGEYPLEPGMTVSALLRAGGSPTDAAYGGKAELTRYRVINGETRSTELITIDLAAVLRGDPTADILLQPFDSLSIKEVSEWSGQEGIELAGEVRFPGRYSIKKGESLKSVVERAGGLTNFAFPAGSVFTREELKRREQEQLDRLTERLQNDLALMALQGAAANQGQAGTALSVGQSLVSQLRSAKAVGRLVIDLPRAIAATNGSDADIILRNGDKLLVPKLQQEVTVIGEVQNQTSHLYRAKLTRDDYIALSGGITRKADGKKIYVVRANGSVIASEGNRWFSYSSVEIRAGDTVVVPLDTERLPALPFWQAVTQIIYNLAISAAAVHSF